MEPVKRTVVTRALRIARRVAVFGLCGLGVSPVATASEVKIFRLQDQPGFLGGTLDGISVDSLGTLRLAARAERHSGLEEPFVLAAAKHPEGWVVGTGNDGRVTLVRPEGGVELLFETEEPEVFAVAVGADGSVYAGSSPDGSLYHWAQGVLQRRIELGQTYIWQIIPRSDGTLLVATGTEGKLLEVLPDETIRTVWDSDDTHVRTLLARSNGSLVAGTAGEGLIVEIGPQGTVRTLYDAPEPEVVALTAGERGEVWAAVLASEASQLPAAGTSTSGDDSSEEGTAVVLVEETGVHLVGSRPPGHRGPRSEILRIAPQGEVEPVARLAEDTVFSMYWGSDRLWVGTGLEGRLYSLQGGELVLENDIDERQIVSLLPDEGGLPALATSNASALYRLSSGRQREGSYVSPVLDAGQMAEFGTFHRFGEVPNGSSLRFSFRSGSSAEPDASWSEWTEPRAGTDLSLSTLPAARFVQWRMLAKGGAASPTLSSAELSYRQHNLAPRISKLEVWPPGKIQVPQSFNPSQQIFEPVHPNREGIFTTLKTTDADNVQRYKSVWKQGFRTLVWAASDPNGDPLRYRLQFRPEGGERWIDVVDEHEEEHLSFDVSGIPDGIYRFQLSASDAEGNPKGLVDRRQSEPVVIDHSPPEVVQAQRSGATLRIDVRDRWNPIRRAEYSVDAGEWQDVRPEDGLLDSRSETLLLPVPEEGSFVVVRLMDAAFNRVTIDVETLRR